MVLPLLPIAAVALAGAAGGAIGGIFGGGGGDTLAEGATKKEGSVENISTDYQITYTPQTTENIVTHAPYEYYAPNTQMTDARTYSYAPYTVIIESSPYATIESSKKDSLMATPTATATPTYSQDAGYRPNTSAEVIPTQTTTQSATGGISDSTKSLILIGGALLLLGGGAYVLLRK